jgi:hypothetical protein
MLNPQYVVGFVDGEGCFSITFNRNRTELPEVRLIFEIELREDDREILERIKEVLQCGNIYYLRYARYAKWRPHVKYKVSNFRDIQEKIIPFFKKYRLQAKKQYQFEKFCRVAAVIEKKGHLTEDGIRRIREIKA